jgi:hypothetical protein
MFGSIVFIVLTVVSLASFGLKIKEMGWEYSARRDAPREATASVTCWAKTCGGANVH